MKAVLIFFCVILASCASKPAKIPVSSKSFSPNKLIIVAPQQAIYVHKFDSLKGADGMTLSKISLHIPHFFVFGVLALTLDSKQERIYEEKKLKHDDNVNKLRTVVEITDLANQTAIQLRKALLLPENLSTEIVTRKQQIDELLTKDDNTLIVNLSFLLTQDLASPILYADIIYQSGKGDQKQVIYKNTLELTGFEIDAQLPTKKIDEVYQAALFSEYESLTVELAQIFKLDIADIENPNDYKDYSKNRFISPIPNSILVTKLDGKYLVRYLGEGRRGALCTLPKDSKRSDGFCRKSVELAN